MEPGNLSFRLRERFKWKPHENLSTDAEYRGGATSISVEGSVMELERRGCIVQFGLNEQPYREGFNWTKQSHFVSNHRLDNRSRMNREVHVWFYESLRGRFPRAT